MITVIKIIMVLFFLIVTKQAAIRQGWTLQKRFLMTLLPCVCMDVLFISWGFHG